MEWHGIKVLTDLSNATYQSGTVSDDWLRSTVIKLPKKYKASECSEYRTVSLHSKSEMNLCSISLILGVA